MSTRDWNTTTNIKVSIKQCTYFISFPLSFSSPIADWHCRMTSMNVKACRSVWGSLLDACPQSPSYKLYDVIGGTVYILKSETIDYIEVDLCQDCSLGFGWKNRLESWQVEFLKKFQKFLTQTFLSECTISNNYKFQLHVVPNLR